MVVRSINAARVLPEELLKQVSDALRGRACQLWIPARKNLNKLARNRYIVRLRDEGHTAADIAARLFISERTVWRVLARARRARRAPSARPASDGKRNFTPGA